ncbi:hypothetical protein QUF72_04260 [Desulfobacterales bacterium HSG2]|nr:hypothetical protein [Desulfobacterales bacterium HSG2]
MKIWFKERIGKPELFTGRKKELSYFLNWTERIKREISMSTAILSRRKTGKTAILQRLYNITFDKDAGVIPFYFEIMEADQWLGSFAEDFFLSFICQYVAFKTRNNTYLSFGRARDLTDALEICKKEGFDFLANPIRGMQLRQREGKADVMWNIAREMPKEVATYTDEYILQMIDEFQFINRHIHRDRGCKDRIANLAGSYLHTAEYKNAPMLVSGSWVGWLEGDLRRMLPGRFQLHYLESLPGDEAVEMILRYSHLESIPVAEEIVPLMAGLTEGNPFYITSLFRSKYPEKNFTSEEGLLGTLEFETLRDEGTIRGIWKEYMGYAMDKSNSRNAKNIVLYLCKHREREVTREELRKKLNLGISDSELEKKLRITVRADIIEQGSTNFDYRGVRDNIFDKVFRGVYQKEINGFDPREITNEYKALYESLKRENRKLMGEYSQYRGKFAEYLIIDKLRKHAFTDNRVFLGMADNLPDDFRFSEYETVWSYSASPIHKRDIQIDILAVAAGRNDYSLIGEVKNRKSKFSVKEAREFVKKAGELIKLENIGKSVLFVFSVNGFYKNTLEYLEKHGIARSSDPRWLKAPKKITGD